MLIRLCDSPVCVCVGLSEWVNSYVDSSTCSPTFMTFHGNTNISLHIKMEKVVLIIIHNHSPTGLKSLINIILKL